jgi:predicted XRE-type DNA-binding protein
MARKTEVKTKQRRDAGHGPRSVTPAGRSVLRDLFGEVEAVELGIRSTLLRGLEKWLEESAMTQTEAAKVLGVTQARVSDLKRGKISQFSMDSLIRLAARAGLHPTVRLVT